MAMALLLAPAFGATIQRAKANR
ncbi:MAG: hypothetical protein QOJ53_1479, partial [Sphingomonadales bacterium]|nr:hypothetical protein [Sphingomonadales bacterium]